MEPVTIWLTKRNYRYMEEFKDSSKSFEVWINELVENKRAETEEQFTESLKIKIYGKIMATIPKEKTLPKQEIYERCAPIDREVVEAKLQELLKSGDIFEPKKGFVKRT